MDGQYAALVARVEQLEALRRRIEPQQVSRDLSAEARRRGV